MSFYNILSSYCLLFLQQPDAMEIDKTSSHQASYLLQWVKGCGIMELLVEGAIKWDAWVELIDRASIKSLM